MSDAENEPNDSYHDGSNVGATSIGLTDNEEMNEFDENAVEITPSQSQNVVVAQSNDHDLNFNHF